MTLITGYFDESGIHSGSGHVVVAGFMGSPSDWAPVEAAWNAHLKEVGVAVFHRSHCMMQKGEYQCFPDWKRGYHLKELANVLGKSRLYAISSAVLIDDWSRCIEPLQDRFPHPYDFLAEMTLETIRSLSQEWWDGEPVALEFSPQSEFSGRLMKVWQGYRATDVGRAISGITYANSSSPPALQTADYLAGEMREFAIGGHRAEGWENSALLRALRLRGAGFLSQYHTEESIKEVVRRGPIGLLEV